ncbi:hypothetical protein BH20CHL6_BH20CHL6_00560 [soil metagenome]
MTGQVIHNGAGALITELAFGRRAMVTPHSNPNTTLFIVISGGGWVQVGEERARVNHGEAVVWPAGEPHGAYTDGTEMRAIVVELSEARGEVLVEGKASQVPANAAEEVRPRGEGQRVVPAQGALAERTSSRAEYDSSEGEPW